MWSITPYVFELKPILHEISEQTRKDHEFPSAQAQGRDINSSLASKRRHTVSHLAVDSQCHVLYKRPRIYTCQHVTSIIIPEQSQYT